MRCAARVAALLPALALLPSAALGDQDGFVPPAPSINVSGGLEFRNSLVLMGLVLLVALPVILLVFAVKALNRGRYERVRIPALSFAALGGLAWLASLLAAFRQASGGWDVGGLLSPGAWLHLLIPPPPGVLLATVLALPAVFLGVLLDREATRGLRSRAGERGLLKEILQEERRRRREGGARAGREAGEST